MERYCKCDECEIDICIAQNDDRKDLICLLGLPNWQPITKEEFLKEIR